MEAETDKNNKKILGRGKSETQNTAVSYSKFTHHVLNLACRKTPKYLWYLSISDSSRKY